MEMQKTFEALVATLVQEKASDLHIAEGRRPLMRVNGKLIPLIKHPEFMKKDIQALIDMVLTPKNKELFTANHEIDFSYSSTAKHVRFRGNGYFQKGGVNFAFRVVPSKVFTIEELGLPAVLTQFTQRSQGFFLVVGPVGHGKTTTLAAMIDHINESRTEHIITIEDPIEYIFEQKQSVIDQREVRLDTEDFHTALHSAFRQDVDVIMVGEMRGLDTIATAVTAAETGHLIFATLHTNNASQTIDRIIDSFPADQQGQIRLQLASTLTGIFSQRLIPRISGGLIPAYELLVSTPAVSNLIREARTHELPTVIETGSENGMVDFNRSLTELVQAKEITVEDAYLHSFNPDALQRML